MCSHVNKVRRAGCAGLFLGLVLGCGSPSTAAPLDELERVQVLAAPTALSEIVLVDANGEDFSLSRLQGKVAFVFFGFTHCADICPMTLQRFREAHASGALDTDKVRFVLVSVDGERDSPEAMRRFLAAYSPDFIGLTGTTADLKNLAKQFRAPFFKGNAAGSPNGNYSVAHSPRIYAVDPGGDLRAELYDGSVETLAGVAEALLAESADVPTAAMPPVLEIAP